MGLEEETFANSFKVNKRIKLFKKILLLVYIFAAIGLEFFYRPKLFYEPKEGESDSPSVKVSLYFQNKIFEKSGFLKSFFLIISELGTAKCTLVFFAITFIFLPINKSLQQIHVIILASYFTNLFKIIFSNPRPIWIKDELHLSCNNGFGNPSGHSFTSVSVYLSFIHLLTGYDFFRKRTVGIVIRIFLFIFTILIILLVLLSRIALGAHAINQVIYGGSLGLGLYFLFFFVIEFHLMEKKEFLEYFSKSTTIICSGLAFLIMFFIALGVYLTNKVDTTQYKEELLKKCPQKSEFKTFKHDGFYQTLSIFGLFGAYFGLYLLYKLATKGNYNREYILTFNTNSTILKFFIRIIILFFSAIGMGLYFFIPGNTKLIYVFVFKSALAFLLGLFGLYGIGIFLCVKFGFSNELIYQIDINGSIDTGISKMEKIV